MDYETNQLAGQAYRYSLVFPSHGLSLYLCGLAKIKTPIYE